MSSCLNCPTPPLARYTTNDPRSSVDLLYAPPRALCGTQSTGSDEPRSPLSLRPLFEWEKSLASHLLDEVSLRWSTSRDEAAAAAAAATTTAVGPPVSGALTQHEEGPAGTDGGGAEGGSWKPGRRGRVRIALDQIGDDGGCRLLGASGGGSGGKGSVGGRGSGPLHPPRHPEAVPECLLGALLPPVRLSCVPFAFDAGGKGGASKGLVDAGRFPRIGVSEAGQVQLDGTAEGLVGVEGEWAVSFVFWSVGGFGVPHVVVSAVRIYVLLC